MDISSSFSIQGAQAVRGSVSSRASGATAVASPESSVKSIQDKLDLSPEAQSIGQTQPSPSEIRVDKIASLRRAISDGTYETPEKVSLALDRLLEQLE